jgi:sugar O-acyltransferase (sialic acid O-acetyltransferase NeuD family)
VTAATVIVGAGGFGRDMLDVVDAANRAAREKVLDLLGFVDDGPTERNLKLLSERGVPYLGTLEEWVSGQTRHVGYLIAVGDPRRRRAIDERLVQAGFHPAPGLVHPTAVLGSGVECGPGSVIFAGVLMKNEIRLGRHVLLNMGCSVGHDVTIGDYVTINPRASVSGECRVENGVMVGVGAVVLQGLRVQAYATVGGMACVVRDVPPNTTVKGVPAR